MASFNSSGSAKRIRLDGDWRSDDDFYDFIFVNGNVRPFFCSCCFKASIIFGEFFVLVFCKLSPIDCFGE